MTYWNPFSFACCNGETAVNGKGKGKWLATFQNKEEFLKDFSELGDTIRVKAVVK